MQGTMLKERAYSSQWVTGETAMLELHMEDEIDDLGVWNLGDSSELALAGDFGDL